MHEVLQRFLRDDEQLLLDARVGATGDALHE